MIVYESREVKLRLPSLDITLCYDEIYQVSVKCWQVGECFFQQEIQSLVDIKFTNYYGTKFSDDKMWDISGSSLPETVEDYWRHFRELTLDRR